MRWCYTIEWHLLSHPYLNQHKNETPKYLFVLLNTNKMKIEEKSTNLFKKPTIYYNVILTRQKSWQDAYIILKKKKTFEIKNEKQKDMVIFDKISVLFIE